MLNVSSESIQLTQATMLRRAADGVYSAIGNVDVTDMLASMGAITLCNNGLRALDGIEFCTNLRALDVCIRLLVARAPAVIRRVVVRRMLFVEPSAIAVLL